MVLEEHVIKKLCRGQTSECIMKAWLATYVRRSLCIEPFVSGNWVKPHDQPASMKTG
jgi:hypothetical protein